jgi:hypothetical protein
VTHLCHLPIGDVIEFPAVRNYAILMFGALTTFAHLALSSATKFREGSRRFRERSTA